MNKNKHTLKEIFFTAVANYKKKDFKTAEITCYKILNIDPNHFDSISLLASISAINQNYKKAKDLLFKVNGAWNETFPWLSETNSAH